jgi:hypothetical protein
MVIGFDDAIPGDTYWLMIDGCGAQICEYEFILVEGVTPPIATQIDTTICADSIEIDGVNYGIGSHQIVYGNEKECDSVVTLNISPQLEVSLVGTSICFPGIDSALISVIAVGSGGGYAFTWNDGATDSTRWMYDLMPGDEIAVTVTDNAGCMATAAASIQSVVHVKLSPEAGIVCPGTAFTDEVEVNISLGSPPYDYEWSPPLPQTIFPPASFELKVTDSDGCEAYATFDVVEVTPPMPVVVPTGVICSDLLLEGVQVSVENPQNYSFFSWTTGAQGPDASSVVISEPGDYTVFVLDIYGCAGSVDFQIESADSPEVDLVDHAPVCPDSLSAGIEIEILTTVDSIAFFGIWNGPSATVFTPGTYGVVVTDSNGCTASDVTVIEVLDTAVASFYPLVTGTTVAFINT